MMPDSHEADGGAGPADGNDAERSDADGLPESRLHVFIDAPRAHALYFLEGQRLVRDLALAHGLPRRGFAFLRDAVLSVEPLIALLSGGSQLGFYLDAEDPAFVFKLEAHHGGDTRCAFLPENFAEFPEHVTGIARVEVRRTAGGEPHQSIVQATSLSLPALVDRVIEDAFQVACALHVSDDSDQSVLLHRLPTLRGEDPAACSAEAARAELARHRKGLAAVLARALTDEGEIASALEELGWRRIAIRPVRFHCNCSRERLVSVLRLAQDPSDLLDEDADSLEATCEYCRETYVITRAELVPPPETVH